MIFYICLDRGRRATEQHTLLVGKQHRHLAELTHEYEKLKTELTAAEQRFKAMEEEYHLFKAQFNKTNV
jgi:hypothetical protein